MRLVGIDERRDLLRTHPRRRRPTDQCALALDLRGGLARQALEPVALINRQLPDEHLRGTHPDLQDRDASRFAARTRIPVNYSETDH
jgi:hypothetical protein